MVLARNNIAGNNLNVTFAIQNTKFDKARVFDKIIVSMVKNCINNFDEKYIDEVLAVDNITKFNNKLEKVYLTYNHSDIETNPSFDDEESKLLHIIYKVYFNCNYYQSDDEIHDKEVKTVKEVKETPLIEEKITINDDFVANVMMELEKSQTRYIIVGLLISLVISILIWQLSNLISRKKKISDDVLINENENSDNSKRQQPRSNSNRGGRRIKNQ